MAVNAGEDYWALMAKLAADALQGWYSQPSGLWASTNWWNAAECVHALTGYMQATGDQRYLAVLANTLTAAQSQHAGFINTYYDDCAWWGLAWTEARRLLGHNPAGDGYWNMAHQIFLHEITGWDTTCGGGMWWSTAKTYKNAITTELLITLAARLHLVTPGDTTLLGWAEKAAAWFLNPPAPTQSMVGGALLVNDGLTTGCQNNNGQTWTYNQGMILSGLAALHQITGNPAYLTAAEPIASTAINTLVTGGVLTEPCEATGNCGADGSQFKGVFIRGLRDLYAQDGNPAYRDFIIANATSLWWNARNVSNQIGLKWAGPFDSADASRQSSALHCLNAAVSIYSTTDA